MQVTSCLQDLGYAASNYKMSNDTAAMEKDGMQSLAIGILSSIRMQQMTEQIANVVPTFSDYYISYIPGTMGLWTALVSPFAASYLANNPNPETFGAKILYGTCTVVVKAAEAFKFVLQHADKLLNIAACVSAVALIALGFTVSGLIGLFGLLLLALKRYSLIPAMLDRFIEPIAILGTLITTIVTPTFIVFKVLGVIGYSIQLADLLINNSFVRAMMPESVRNPLLDKHIVHEAPETQEAVLKDMEDRKFTVNTSYVYANEVGNLLPTDYDETLKKLSAEELFTNFEAKIQAENMELTDIEKNGLNDLKTCAISGRGAEKMPNDVELFQKVIKALVDSIMNDDLNFKLKVKELAEIGNSCHEGWTRDVTAMLAPETKRIEWAVHNILAKMRGGIVKEAITDFNANMNNFSALNLDMAGGSNNIHITNAIEVAYWHRLRTFEGELYMQLNPPMPTTSLFLRHVVLGDNTAEIKTIENLYMALVMQQVHLGLAVCGGMIPLIQRDITRAFTDPKRIIDIVNDAITPYYVEGPDGRPEERRLISRDAVQAWMADIAKRRNIEMDDPDQIDRWLKVNEEARTFGHTSYQLTLESVKLLLWDMGILNHRSQALMA